MLSASSLRVIAHRGVSAECPENSMAAFSRAIEIGCAAIELDVRLSADGVPMVIHDAALSRSHGRPELVSDHSSLDLSRWGVPTLEAVIDLCKGRLELCIELKGEDLCLPHAVLPLCQRLADWRILSFSAKMLEVVAAAGFRDRCVLNMLQPQQADWPILSCSIEAIDAAFVKEAHLHHREAWAFTCNSDEEFRYASDLGLDAVFSDYGQLPPRENMQCSEGMERDFSTLHSGTFDLLIVGGGIYGAWAAYDAALRGLRVAIIDQGDWGCGTSQSSSKLVHGGLRYLEHFNFGLVRKAIDERRRLSRLGPHRVRPLRFIIPNYIGDRVSPVKFRLGLMIYDWFAGRGQPGARHRQISNRESAKRWPFLKQDKLRASFSYGDCETDDARLVLELISGAISAGAVAVNYARAKELIREGEKDESRVVGATVCDTYGDSLPLNIRAKVVFAPVGPWVDSIHSPPSEMDRVRLIQGVHLVMPSLGCEQAFLLTADDGRIFFLIPWYGRTLLGTTELDHSGRPEEVEVTQAEIEYLLRNANATFDNLGWEESDIYSSFVGLRTLPNEKGSASAVSREWELTQPERGLLLPIGGKLTSARADAAEVIDKVFQMIGLKPVECQTSSRPFPWRPQGDWPTFVRQCFASAEELGLDEECTANAACRYGSNFALLKNIIQQQPQLAERIHPELPFCKAEVVLAKKCEMACTDEDIFRRRVPIWLLNGAKPITES